MKGFDKIQPNAEISIGILSETSGQNCCDHRLLGGGFGVCDLLDSS